MTRWCKAAASPPLAAADAELPAAPPLTPARASAAALSSPPCVRLRLSASSLNSSKPRLGVFLRHTSGQNWMQPNEGRVEGTTEIPPRRWGSPTRGCPAGAAWPRRRSPRPREGFWGPPSERCFLDAWPGSWPTASGRGAGPRGARCRGCSLRHRRDARRGSAEPPYDLDGGRRPI